MTFRPNPLVLVYKLNQSSIYFQDRPSICYKLVHDTSSFLRFPQNLLVRCTTWKLQLTWVLSPGHPGYRPRRLYRAETWTSRRHATLLTLGSSHQATLRASNRPTLGKRHSMIFFQVSYRHFFLFSRLQRRYYFRIWRWCPYWYWPSAKSTQFSVWPSHDGPVRGFWVQAEAAGLFTANSGDIGHFVVFITVWPCRKRGNF